MQKAVLYILCLFFIFILCGCNTSGSVDEKASDIGVLDLTDINTLENSVRIAAEWECYNNKHLNYETIFDNKPDYYCTIPAHLENDLSKVTYRIHVKTSLQAGEQLCLSADPACWKYVVFINDTKITEGGLDTKTYEHGQGRLQAIFTVPSSEFDIILNITNNIEIGGGFLNDFYIRKNQVAVDDYDKDMKKIFFIEGALLLTFALYLLNTVFNKELIYMNYLAVFCLCLVFILDIFGLNIFYSYVYILGFRNSLLIWYSGTMWMGYFWLKYISQVFRKQIPTSIIHVIMIITLAFQVLMILFPLSLYTKYYFTHGFRILYLLPYTQIICALVICVKATMNKAQFGWIYLAFTFIPLSLFTYVLVQRVNYTNDNILINIFCLLIMIFLLFQSWNLLFQIKCMRERKMKYELVFLQSQIKPHFLFNSLNTIVSISTSEPEKAKSLLHDFNLFFKESVNIKELDRFISLEEELNILTAYLNLEKSRLGDRLEMITEYPKNLSVQVPSYILQPIVENAVVHGIYNKAGIGKIEVIVEHNDGNLNFLVKDNGVGFEASKLAQQVSCKSNHGIALENVRKRLKILYNTELKICSSSEGAEISWSIPAKMNR